MVVAAPLFIVVVAIMLLLLAFAATQLAQAFAAWLRTSPLSRIPLVGGAVTRWIETVAVAGAAAVVAVMDGAINAGVSVLAAVITQPADALTKVGNWVAALFEGVDSLDAWIHTRILGQVVPYIYVQLRAVHDWATREATDAARTGEAWARAAQTNAEQVAATLFAEAETAATNLEHNAVRAAQDLYNRVATTDIPAAVGQVEGWATVQLHALSNDLARVEGTLSTDVAGVTAHIDTVATDLGTRIDTMVHQAETTMAEALATRAAQLTLSEQDLADKLGAAEQSLASTVAGDVTALQHELTVAQADLTQTIGSDIGKLKDLIGSVPGAGAVTIGATLAGLLTQVAAISTTWDTCGKVLCSNLSDIAPEVRALEQGLASVAELAGFFTAWEAAVSDPTGAAAAWEDTAGGLLTDTFMAVSSLVGAVATGA